MQPEKLVLGLELSLKLVEFSILTLLFEIQPLFTNTINTTNTFASLSPIEHITDWVRQLFGTVERRLNEQTVQMAETREKPNN